MMTSPRCPTCGQAIAGGSNFCGYCGSKLVTQPVTSQDTSMPVSSAGGIFGENKYIVEQKLLALRDTFGIKNMNGNLLAYIKKQYVSFGPKFWFETPDGARLGEIHGKILTIRPTFEIYDSGGQMVAAVKKKLLKLLGSEWWMENAAGVEIAKIKGNILQHDYYVQTPSGELVGQVHKKWVTVRDSYCIEILSARLSPFLVISYAIALDHVEDRK